MVYRLSFSLKRDKNSYEYFRVLSKSVAQYLRYKWLQGEDDYILAYDLNELKFFVVAQKKRGKTKVEISCYEPFGVIVFRVNRKDGKKTISDILLCK